MTDQTQTPAETSTSKKGYNITMTPKGEINTAPTSKGVKKIRFRATFESRGRQVERTVVAQGKAADAIEGKIVSGEQVALRVVFDRAPANDDGKPGGEFLSVIGLPLPKAA